MEVVVYFVVLGLIVYASWKLAMRRRQMNFEKKRKTQIKAMLSPRVLIPSPFRTGKPRESLRSVLTSPLQGD